MEISDLFGGVDGPTLLTPVTPKKCLELWSLRKIPKGNSPLGLLYNNYEDTRWWSDRGSLAWA